MSKLELTVTDLNGAAMPNAARFAEYIGVVSQINGSLVNAVTVNGRASGPESMSADGQHLTIGANHLPPIDTGKPAALAAWCGVSLHGFAHSRYSPRTNEPLRATLAQRNLHRTWNMVEDARIERLLLRDFPGWQPHLMAACAHVLFRGEVDRWGRIIGRPPTLSSVFPLVVGRTYLPADLRAECYDAFADEHSTFVADAVRDLVWQYMSLMDPGSEDHDETVDIVTRLRSLLGDYGTECGSHDGGGLSEETRVWSDPGDVSEDDDDEEWGDDDIDPDAEPEDDDGGDVRRDDGDDGNHVVTDDDGEEGDESADAGAGDDDSDGDDDDADGAGAGDDGDDGAGDDQAGDGAGDDGTDADGDDADGAGGDGEDGGGGDETEGEWDDDDQGDADDGGSDGVGGGGEFDSTSRLVDWSSAITSALEQDEELRDMVEAVTMGPMPEIQLPVRDCKDVEVPADVRLAEEDIARELRSLMDGVRPGMRRRVDRGRFNITRVVREGGATRPEEMFDRHDPGALRSTGCAVAVLADISSSMGNDGLFGVTSSVWSIEQAVRSVRGQFRAWSFGFQANVLPESTSTHMKMTKQMEGDTQPLPTLSAAAAWLSNQREPNKLCIVATDGAWGSPDACNDVIRSMTGQGFQVAVFGIEAAGWGIGSDFNRRFVGTGAAALRIKSAADLGPAVGHMLVNRVKSSLPR